MKIILMNLYHSNFYRKFHSFYEFYFTIFFKDFFNCPFPHSKSLACASLDKSYYKNSIVQSFNHDGILLKDFSNVHIKKNHPISMKSLVDYKCHWEHFLHFNYLIVSEYSYQPDLDNYYFNIRFLKLELIFRFFTIMKANLSLNGTGIHVNISARRFYYQKLLVLFDSKFRAKSRKIFSDLVYYDEKEKLPEALKSLSEIEKVLSELLKAFYALINEDSCYKNIKDKEVYIELYEQILQFKHPYFDQISKYFDYAALQLPNEKPIKIFDLPVFLEIFASIYIYRFFRVFLEKREFISEKYGVNLKIAFFDLDNYPPNDYELARILSPFTYIKDIIRYLDSFDLTVLDDVDIGISGDLLNPAGDVVLEKINAIITNHILYKWSFAFTIFQKLILMFSASDFDGRITFGSEEELDVILQKALRMYIQEELKDYIKKNPIQENAYYYIIKHIIGKI